MKKNLKGMRSLKSAAFMHQNKLDNVVIMDVFGTIHTKIYIDQTVTNKKDTGEK